MNFDYLDAVILSLLPYRQSFYSAGGWSRRAGTILYPSCSDELNEFLVRHFSRATIKRVLQECQLYRTSKEQKFPFVTFWDERYPDQLRHIFDPPPVLFWSGDPPDFTSPCVSVVGTRKPAPVSIAAVLHLIHSKKMAELTIVSGFARGIDRLAHCAAIERGLRGFAVMGSGIARPSPRSNLDLMDRANSRGVPFTLLSEFPPFSTGRDYHFVRRNRIIAGLSSTLYVVQAPRKSGALITARFALEEGRSLFFFDHPLLRKGDANTGAIEMLEEGASPLVIPRLEKNLYSERTVLAERDSELRREFWKKRQEGRLLWLGEDLFASVPPGMPDQKEEGL